jgi:citrate lyase subunit beta / citryl-CoA lyase
MQPIRSTRSQLYVPADRPSWYEKAIATGADAVVIDLEDSVPADSKDTARKEAGSFLRDYDGTPRPLFSVRVNDRYTPWFLDDVCAMVEAGIDCVAMPKVSGPNDVVALDCLLGAIERRCDRAVGSTLIHPILETPAGIRDAYAVGMASPRVAYMGGVATPGGDIEAGIGFDWTTEGTESLAYRSNVLIDARAAEVPYPVTGLWTLLSDLDGLRRYAQQGRGIGYDGMTVIHPSHVSVVNEVFSPSREELERDRRLIKVMEEAEGEGSASVRFEGRMVDVAMVKRASARLADAEVRSTQP